MALTSAEKNRRYRARIRAQLAELAELKAASAAGRPCVLTRSAVSSVVEELASCDRVSPSQRAIAVALAGVLDDPGGVGKPQAAKELRSLMESLRSPQRNAAADLASILAEAMKDVKKRGGSKGDG